MLEERFNKKFHPASDYGCISREDILDFIKDERKKIIEEIKEFMRNYQCEYCNPDCNCNFLEESLNNLLNKLN